MTFPVGELRNLHCALSLRNLQGDLQGDLPVSCLTRHGSSVALRGSSRGEGVGEGRASSTVATKAAFERITTTDRGPDPMASRSSIDSAGEPGAVKAGVFRRLGRPIALVAAVLAATMLLASTASAQTTLTTGTALTSNWTAARWAASGTTYTSPWVSGGTSSFADGLSFTFGRLAASTWTATLGPLTTGTGVNIGFNTAGIGQILEFGGATNRTFTIGQNSVVNFATVTLQNSGASANGLIKEGTGTLVMGGGSYTGGLQLKNGTLIASAQNLFGQGTVDIYGGTKLGYSSATFTPATANSRSSITLAG
ncbi:MAG: hypothetical protein EXS06_02975 [Planctomycetaceae bacterium]|nr:hypothetical protein [Planctomycetaceae bacterium]